MTSTKLQNAANFATVFAAIVAAGAFFCGYHQFRETQQATRETLMLQRETLEEERESQAVELLIKYNEIMKEPPSNPESAQGAAQFWRDNVALIIAESIYKLGGEVEGWKNTVNWMISHHAEFIKTQRLNCTTFDNKFIKFVKQLVGEDICISQ